MAKATEEREQRAERVVLHPPEYQELSGPVIFLAGPIQGSLDWQAEAIELLGKERPDVHIASPRRDYLDGEFVYEAQVNWETHYLRRAAEHGAIIFWLARENEHDCGRSYAQTSRFEIAEWKEIQRNSGCGLVIGIQGESSPGADDAFSGARYIKHRYGQDCPDVPVVDSLEETCRAALKAIRQTEL